MATFSKEFLSASTDGLAIKIAATSTPGTLVHTTLASAAAKDEVWLYAYNSHTGTVALTVQWGGTASPDDEITLTIPAKAGLTLVVPGNILRGTGVAGRDVRAFAATTNVVTISGYVNRIA